MSRLFDSHRSRPAWPELTEGTGAPEKGHDALAEYRQLPVIRTRPRWALRALGATLILSAIAGSLLVLHTLRATTDVLVLAHDVAQGNPLTRADLTVATINSDAGVQAVPKNKLASVLGLAASRPLDAGDLLNSKMLTTAVVPGADQTLVGITVGIGKLPAAPLRPGDLVRLVDTPRDQDNSPVQAPITSNAQVVSMRPGPPNTQATTVDVIVPHAEANWVAARAATARLAIVLDSRVR